MSTYDPAPQQDRSQQQTPDIATPTTAPTSAPPGAMVQLREATRTMDYADGVQFLQPGGEAEASLKPGVHETAAAGVAGSGSALPGLDQIQQSFGRHDVSGVQAHVGGAAAQANQAMGAQAYATGNDVAFGSQPDMHTAAHEAAHVVQQRGGVQLKGGVGEKGDAYEQHADAVADAVVKGESAEKLLDQKAGEGGGDESVQAYAGNLDVAHNAADGGATTIDVRAERDKRHGPGEYDANENPKLKVEFEVALARALMVNRDFFMPVVEAVSRGVGLYIEAKAESLGKTEEAGVREVFEQACRRMSFMYGAGRAGAEGDFGDVKPDTFYGRLMDLNASSDATPDRYYESMQALMEEGAGNASNHLLLHQSFSEFVAHDRKAGVDHKPLLKAVSEKVAGMERMAEEQKAILSGAGSEDMKPGGLRDERYDKHAGGEGSIGEGRNARGRYGKGDAQAFEEDQPGLLAYDKLGGAMEETRRDQMVGIADDQTAQASQTKPLSAEETEAGLGQKGSRGVEMYMLDESQAFVQQARMVYNMPLAAGISGTTTDLMEVAIMFGVNDPKQRFLYALACVGHLGSIGAHSFHEIMTSCAQAGVPYTPGDYRSILPALPGDHPAKLLFEDARFKNVPGIGENPAPATPAGTGAGAEGATS